MISGVVNHHRQPFVTLDVVGVSSLSRSVDFLVDTGFNGGISLPESTIQLLGLVGDGEIYSVLGDGRRIALPVYRGTLVWEDELRSVTVVVTRGQPLLGMSLVVGHRIIIDMIDGGTVRLERRG